MAAAAEAALAILALSLIGWAFLAWIALDMGHPVAQLTMPGSSSWSAANVLAIWLMWALMMAAMMLPSALPMILTFVQLALRSGERGAGAQLRRRLSAGVVRLQRRGHRAAVGIAGRGLGRPDDRQHLARC